MIQVILVGCHRTHSELEWRQTCVNATHEICEHLLLGGFATNDFINNDRNLPCPRSTENDASFGETRLRLPWRRHPISWRHLLPHLPPKALDPILMLLLKSLNVYFLCFSNDKLRTCVSAHIVKHGSWGEIVVGQCCQFIWGHFMVVQWARKSCAWKS